MDDLDKLKVADLKRELKTRGLSVTGNKAELQQRLLDAGYLNSSIDEGNILRVDNDADLENLEDVQEDAVLGIDSAGVAGSKVAKVSTPAVTTTSVTSKSPQKAPASFSVNQLLNSVGKTPEKKKHVDITPPPDPVGASTKKTTQIEGASAASDATATVRDGSPTSAATAGVISLKRPSETITSTEKLERAKKFNTALNTDTKKQLRAERFGTIKPGAATAKVAATAETASKPTTVTTTSDDALQKRADRFGVKNGTAAADGATDKPKRIEVTAPADIETLKKRAARFGLNAATVATDQRMLMRKQKFGGGDETSTGETDAKKQKRAERFKTA